MNTETLLLMQENFNKMAEKLDSLGGVNPKGYKQWVINGAQSYEAAIGNKHKKLLTVQGKGYVKKILLWSNWIDRDHYVTVIVDGEKYFEMGRMNTVFEAAIPGGDVLFTLNDFSFNKSLVVEATNNNIYLKMMIHYALEGG